MKTEIEFTTTATGGEDGTIFAGNKEKNGKVVARGVCPHCGATVGLRQVHESTESEKLGDNFPAICGACQSFVVISADQKQLHPTPNHGFSNLPNPVASPYEEAVEAQFHELPNSASTMFRATIQAICVHYNVTDIGDKSNIYNMINKLAEEGYITENHRKGLNAVKDIGNDGAHINENEPDMEQVKILRDLVDSVLNATIVAEQYLEEARDMRPNNHTE